MLRSLLIRTVYYSHFLFFIHTFFRNEVFFHIFFLFNIKVFPLFHFFRREDIVSWNGNIIQQNFFTEIHREKVYARAEKSLRGQAFSVFHTLYISYACYCYQIFYLFYFLYNLKNADIEIRAKMLIFKRYILRSLPIS